MDRAETDSKNLYLLCTVFHKTSRVSFQSFVQIFNVHIKLVLTHV